MRSTLSTRAWGTSSGELALDQQCDRARGDRITGVVVPVERATGARGEARARHDAAAVFGDGGDLDVDVPDALPHVETGEQVVPTHARASSPIAIRPTRCGQRSGIGVRVPGGHEDGLFSPVLTAPLPQVWWAVPVPPEGPPA